MQEYELCALFAGDKTSEEIDELSGQIEKIIQESEAKIKYSYPINREKLAYSIYGQNYGEYRVWLFEAEPETANSLNEKLRHTQYLLRHLILKLEGITIDQRIKNLKDPKKDPHENEEKPNTNAKTSKLTQIETEKEGHEKIDEESKNKSKKEDKVSLEQLDEKLDELLKDDKI